MPLSRSAVLAGVRIALGCPRHQTSFLNSSSTYVMLHPYYTHAHEVMYSPAAGPAQILAGSGAHVLQPHSVQQPHRVRLHHCR